MQKVGPELILPPPPLKGEDAGGGPVLPRGIHNKNVFIDDLHHLDRVRLREKIESDDDLRNIRVLEKPIVMNHGPPSSDKASPLGGANIGDGVLVVKSSGDGLVMRSSGDSPVVQGGEDKDPIVRQRRDKVKEVCIKIWIYY